LDGHQHNQRPHWPRLSYDSLDGQPNDRVGRKQQRQLFQHRRQILRAIQRDADANCNNNSNYNCNSDSNNDGDGHVYTYT
jgi:hypothetical protein